MQPKISIITITYNAELFLEKTIKSIIKQTYANIEYIIIDGGSKDKTLEIANRYKSYINVLVSESDKGIYDAMNKGLERATGEYVWFMNAGDEVFSPDTLSNIFGQISAHLADIYYGETEFRNLENQYLGLRSEVTPLKLPENLSWASLQMGLVVCHQAVIVRRVIAPKYDLMHRYSADIDWIIKVLRQAEIVCNCKATVAIYLQGGFSRRNLLKSLLDRFSIMRIHYGLWRTVFNHFRIVLRSVFFLLSKRKTYTF